MLVFYTLQLSEYELILSWARLIAKVNRSLYTIENDEIWVARKRKSNGEEVLSLLSNAQSPIVDCDTSSYVAFFIIYYADNYWPIA